MGDMVQNPRAIWTGDMAGMVKNTRAIWKQGEGDMAKNARAIWKQGKGDMAKHARAIWKGDMDDMAKKEPHRREISARLELIYRSMKQATRNDNKQASSSRTFSETWAVISN